jgi:hypothetical protein
VRAAGPGAVGGGQPAAAPLADGLVAHHPGAALDLAVPQLPHCPAGLQGERFQHVACVGSSSSLRLTTLHSGRLTAVGSSSSSPRRY